MQRPSFWKIMLGLVLTIFFAMIAFLFAQTFRYYRAMKSGLLNYDPIEKAQLQSKISRALEQRPVTAIDVAKLDDPKSPHYGSSTSTLSVSIFLDYDCPYCKEAYPAWRELMNLYKDRVRFVAHEYPIEELHPTAFRASVATLCANNQGKYWQYHDKLYTHTSQRDDRSYIQFAREVGLNEEVFRACLQEQKTADRVRADQLFGAQLGVVGTPTFFFQGVRVDGVLERDQFRALLDQFLETLGSAGSKSGS